MSDKKQKARDHPKHNSEEALSIKTNWFHDAFCQGHFRINSKVSTQDLAHLERWRWVDARRWWFDVRWCQNKAGRGEKASLRLQQHNSYPNLDSNFWLSNSHLSNSTIIFHRTAWGWHWRPSRFENYSAISKSSKLGCCW